MKFNNQKDDKNNQLASAISDLYSSIDIPNGEAAWRRMQTRLIQQQKRSHRKRAFKIGIAIAGVSLILGTFATSPKESYASMRSFFTMVKDAKQGVVDILFGEKERTNTNGAITAPPPDALGSKVGQENSSTSSTMSGGIVVEEVTTLETARNKLDYKMRLADYVPNNFSLNRVRLFLDTDKIYHSIRIEYKNEAGEFFFITERQLNTDGTGWKSSINESSGKIEDVSINGLNGVLVLYTEGGMRLAWLWDDVLVEIQGKLSEEQVLKIARSMK
ncbi:DUF4367 domain-containing protein [Paenibacillus sp. PR3]|uniref:DUF4367 domain-containing protein n=1 Tax=Paenibacillus terricola TaxID=2763503 RepID=A0ABR8MSN9_9BACL|nr:DUF4367 domain-containing protein [Paenibacillus terricola]MBD3918998.1 DUF4367 domain-containing protein [Paenibacillus terricola]